MATGTIAEYCIPCVLCISPALSLVLYVQGGSPPGKHENAVAAPSAGIKRPHEEESDGEKSDEGELVVDEVCPLACTFLSSVPPTLCSSLPCFLPCCLCFLLPSLPPLPPYPSHLFHFIYYLLISFCPCLLSASLQDPLSPAGSSSTHSLGVDQRPKKERPSTPSSSKSVGPEKPPPPTATVLPNTHKPNSIGPSNGPIPASSPSGPRPHMMCKYLL